jgi:hypothetical protein
MLGRKARKKRFFGPCDGRVFRAFSYPLPVNPFSAARPGAIATGVARMLATATRISRTREIVARAAGQRTGRRY